MGVKTGLHAPLYILFKCIGRKGIMGIVFESSLSMERMIFVASSPSISGIRLSPLSVRSFKGDGNSKYRIYN